MLYNLKNFVLISNSANYHNAGVGWSNIRTDHSLSFLDWPLERKTLAIKASADFNQKNAKI